MTIAIDLVRVASLPHLRDGAFLHEGPFASGFLIATFAAALFIAVGFLELTSRRTEMELRLADSEVRTLRGIVPICSSCKKVRDDQGYWNAVEAYVEAHTEAQFSHGLCPDCMRALYPSLDARRPE